METVNPVVKKHVFGLTIVRVVLGVIFVMHGAYKVIGFDVPGFGGMGGLAKVVAGFTSMGMPPVLAYLVCFGEFFGGIALVFGFLSRLAAFGIMVIMAGAIYTVHLKNGFFLNWYLVPGVQHGYEFNFALIGMCLAIIFSGPGCLAIDNLFCRKKAG